MRNAIRIRLSSSAVEPMDFLRGKIAGYKLSKGVIFFADELPPKAAGKGMKQMLKEGHR